MGRKRMTHLNCLSLCILSFTVGLLVGAGIVIVAVEKTILREDHETSPPSANP